MLSSLTVTCLHERIKNSQPDLKKKKRVRLGREIHSQTTESARDKQKGMGTSFSIIGKKILVPLSILLRGILRCIYLAGMF